MSKINFHPLAERDMINLYASGSSLVKIAEKYDVSRTAITSVLNKHNIPIKDFSEYRRYKINEHFFDEYNTRNSWVMGIIWSDGNLMSNNGWGWRINISSKEEGNEILEKCKLFLHFEGPISYKYNALNITCVSLAEKLISLGLVPNKSLVIEMPKNIPDQYLRDFVRGFWDGDGNIRNIKKDNHIHYTAHCTSGSVKMIDALIDIIDEKCNIDCDKQIIYQGNNEYFRINIQDKVSCMKFYDWIYHDDMQEAYLTRKWDYARYQMECAMRSLPPSIPVVV